MNNLISRQEAVDELIAMREHIDARMSVIGCTAYEMAIEALREPERKKGEWIDAWRSAMDGTRHWYRECSECGYERDDDNIDKDTNFCPNCGVEMRQRGDENAIN